MLFSTIFVLAIATGSAMAIPGKHTPKSCDISQLPLVLPPNPPNTTAGLSSPPPPATAVLLGVGYQNYTCSAAGQYTAAGAVADLFDISCLSKNKNKFDSVEDTAYDQWVKTKAPKYDPKGCSDDTSFVGYHFFQKTDTGSAPVWDLRTFKKDSTAYVVGAKVGGIPAPVNPDKNVPWLQIKGVEGSLATMVYRTETRGGVAPVACSAGVSPPFQVKYTTKYWLYGGLTL